MTVVNLRVIVVIQVSSVDSLNYWREMDRFKRYLGGRISSNWFRGVRRSLG